MPDEERQTLSVPEAGKKYYGLSRNKSYQAAEVGDIPTIRVGKLLRVPVRAMERIMDSVKVPALAPFKKTVVRKSHKQSQKMRRT